ncbi:MAG TPA: acyl-CoA dehydrogenase family protein [Polyangia bacterium]|jgi:hypothetical protein|nr:acyl-CoA dehydrogenase family protein [Polyangia bacterium]
MDFQLTEEQRRIQERAREYAGRELAPRAAERDRTEAFPEQELRDLGRLGLLGVNVSRELGGSQAGVVAYSLAMQEVAAVDASVAVAMAVTNMVAEVVSTFGNEAQRRAHVPHLCSGEYVAGAFALSEPQAGSDPAGMTTRAIRTADGWRLDGTKQWITSGDHAGLIVVWAKTDPQPGAKGISAFLVRRGTPGLEAGKHEDKMGLRGSTTVPLILEDCRVGPEALLGKEGDGFRIAMMALDGGRIGIASQACGVARTAISACVAQLRAEAGPGSGRMDPGGDDDPPLCELGEFGAPRAPQQAFQLRLADMATELDAARLLTLRAAWLKQSQQPFSREASVAKLYASEAAGRICDAAVQLLGLAGYGRAAGVERLVRDVRVQRIYEGTSEIQRIVIARTLLKEGGR